MCPPLVCMSRRIYLPVLDPRLDIDRRLVLRGAAAGLLASLVACVAPSEPQPGGTDAGGGGGGGGSGGSGSGSGGTQPGPGFARCGAELCIPLSEPANVALRTV